MPDVRDYLTDVEYPCGREELLRCATAHGAGDQIIGRLGTLPEQEYADADAVHKLLGPESP
ncbi:DUF2795 domain-containing protein [Amycolatopsis sp. NPDC051373]|uniref:DUF2795 domain-containing protein n=1 Tax=Amycolatopsis sp. NPDC051373 TaxID=3155801 RepID=UPI00344F8EE1